MNICPEHLSALRNLGYTNTEARFLNAGRSHRFAEIERSAVDGTDFTRRYLLRVSGKKGIGRDGKFVVEDIA